ncbi:MAG: HD-GYP domain-containing protein [Thermodesulfovibrio sp.]|nr:HD-GYP domain-containing protein [Thermodesulfovibrio sp.]
MKLYKRYLSEELFSGTLNFYKNQLISIHQFAESLSRIIDIRDPYTANHSEEVAEIGYIIALSFGMKEQEAEKVHVAGHLHDIGKIGIPESILTKKGKLTEIEWKIIKKHPVIGAEILKPVSSLEEIRDMVLYHHERFDGKGYPSGIREEEIPIGARIIAIADALSAMTRDRAYRKALSFEEAIRELKNNATLQFDPNLIEATMDVSDIIYQFLYERKEIKNDTSGFVV